MLNSQNERIIIFGASRGLGAAVAAELKAEELLLISRKISKTASASKNVQKLDLDLSLTQDQEKAIETANAFAPTRIFYFVGGGPYGPYAEKNWRDHDWAFQVNFLFAARLVHTFAKDHKDLQQLILTGSAIAESAPDTNASSYSVAKHALKALFENLKHEKLNFDLRLFSPGYMDTGMLPKKAWPRELEKVLNPTEVAKTFCEWAFDAQASGHKILK